MAGCERSSAASPLVHPILAGRRSPSSFDASAKVSQAQVDVLLDAARLAPSAGNSQPWAFIAARRDDGTHRRIIPHVAPSAARWAGAASLIMVNLTQVGVADVAGWQYSEFARYDLGQAVAHMTIQGLVLGLDAHQFRAFDRDALAEEFAVPAHWEVTSITAFGVAVPVCAESWATGTEVRRSRDDVTWARSRGDRPFL